MIQAIGRNGKVIGEFRNAVEVGNCFNIGLGLLSDSIIQEKDLIASGICDCNFRMTPFPDGITHRDLIDMMLKDNDNYVSRELIAAIFDDGDVIDTFKDSTEAVAITGISFYDVMGSARGDKDLIKEGIAPYNFKFINHD